MLGIPNQLAADHVVTVHEDDGLVFRSDLGKGRVLVHKKIAKTKPPAGVHVGEI